MKVSFVISGFARRASGGHKIIYEYANYLVEHGCEVHIYFLNINSLSNIRIPKIAKCLLASLVIKYSNIKWFNLHKKVKRHPIREISDKNIVDCDVVVACDVRTPTAVFELSQSKGKKFYLIQDFENWHVSNEYVCETYTLNMKKIVIAKWLKEIVDRYSSEPSTLIPDGIDIETFKSHIPYFNREKHSICFHYRQSPIKGCKYAIETVKILKDEYPDLIVKVVSNEKRPDILPDWCNYFYNQQVDEVAKINNSVRVFMCTSINEGYGLPALEAMACGCSVVSSDYLGIKEYGIDEYNVLFSPVKDPVAMALNIKRIFEDDQLAEQLSLHGRETGKRFSNELSCRKFFELVHGE